jgi:3-phenylpropionate/cinnamic acid dioxygenase small subunit
LKKGQDMTEYGEIVASLAGLMWALDHHDRERFSDSWSENLDFEVVMFGQKPMRVAGRDALIRSFTGNWTDEPSSLRHQLGAIAVEQLGEDRVRARFYCTYINVGPEPTLAGMGEYDDELVREGDGRWRVCKRRHVFLAPLTH